MTSVKWLPVDYTRTPVRDIVLNGRRVPSPEITQAEVQQDTFMHDRLVFQMVMPNTNQMSGASDWPVYLRWGGGAAQGTFYGYVQTAAPVVDRNTVGTARLVEFDCLGCTSVLQSGTPKSFPGMTADQIVGSILSPYKLALVADPHPYKFPRMVQTNETDWQFIVNLAQQIGYVVSSSGVTVYFQDPLKLVRSTGYSVPLSSIDANSGNPSILKSNMRVGARGNIAQFTQLTVNGLDGVGNVTTGSTAYDQRASLLGRYTVEPTTTRQETQCVAQDAGHAQVIAQATNNPDQWPLQNTVIAKGDGRLRAGVVASLGLGPRSEMGGLWYTRNVSHTLGRASYLMTTEVARDAVSKSPDTTPVIVSSDRSGPLTQPAQPVLLNNRWTSPWSPS